VFPSFSVILAVLEEVRSTLRQPVEKLGGFCVVILQFLQVYTRKQLERIAQ